MMNLDELRQQKEAIRAKIAEGCREADEAKIGEALDQFMKFTSDAVMAEANGVIDSVDRSVLSARGLRQLTSEETKFYNSVIANARQEGEQTVITNIGQALPETIIDSVMDDMRAAYPLLDMIDFTNTGAAIKWVINTQGAQSAEWGALNSAFTKDLAGAIQVIDLTQSKLTAFMFTTQDMLALGPQWVDRYVRAILADALSAGLEAGIVDGNGKDCPIGMTRNFTGNFNASTGYARKSATAVTALDPTTYGTLLSTLATDGVTSRPRAISRVILVVNPVDYFSKVVPATTLLTPTGVYANNVLPFPTDIVQSVGVPAGHAVIGIANKYFMGVGTGKGGKLEYSDEYKFLEDLRTYKIRFYGTGRPKDINAFLYLDISNLAPTYPTVNGVNTTTVSGEVTTKSGS